MATANEFEFRRTPFLIADRPALDFQARSRPLPLQQHPFYAAAMQSLGADIDSISVLQDGKAVLRGYSINRQFFKYIKVTSILRGPLWTSDTIPADIRLGALKVLRGKFSNWRWRFLSLMPEMADDQASRSLMKKAGFSRVITGTTTIWIDLDQPEEDLIRSLDGKWRNQLKKAKAENISISVGGSKPKHYNWLLEMEKQQQGQKGYHALPLGFVNAYQQAGRTLKHSDQNILSVSAIEKGKKIAGALFLLHGNSATYHIGWSGERGRALNAHNLSLFESVAALRQHGVRWLDMGGLDTGPNAGIARFKLGLGVASTTLVGTYL